MSLLQAQSPSKHSSTKFIQQILIEHLLPSKNYGQVGRHIDKMKQICTYRYIVEYICWLVFLWLQMIGNSNWHKLKRGTHRLIKSKSISWIQVGCDPEVLTMSPVGSHSLISFLLSLFWCHSQAQHDDKKAASSLRLTMGTCNAAQIWFKKNHNKRTTKLYLSRDHLYR